MHRAVILTVTLYFVFYTSVASASCVRLTKVMTDATVIFTGAQPPDSGALQRLGDAISELNNDAMLRILQATGQAQHFGEIRNILTILRFVSQNSDPAEATLAPYILQDMERITDIVSVACEMPDGSIRPDDPEFGPADQQSGATQLKGLAGSLQRTGSFTNFTDDVLPKTRDYIVLIAVILGFILFCGIAYMAHYAIIACRIIYRGRHNCHLPARLEILAQTEGGYIGVIGLYGCIFRVSDDQADIDLVAATQGTYCVLKLGEVELNARVMKDADRELHLWFSKALTRKTLYSLLAESEVLPTYDFRLLKEESRRGGTFGLGPLPFS